MHQVIRERIVGGLTAAAGMVALVGGLALIDRRVRRQLVLAFSSTGPTDQLSAVSERLGSLVYIVLQAAREQTIEHAPLVIFGLAAAVLVLFMLRT